MKQIFFLLLSVQWASQLFSSRAKAYDNYQPFRTRPLSVNLNFDYYKTEANFDADGAQQSFAAGYSYQIMNFTPNARYQLGPSWAVIAGFNIATAESNDAQFSRKNSVLNRGDVAGEYLFFDDSRKKFFFRLAYEHPLESIDRAVDTVLTSDAATQIKPEAILNFSFEDGLYGFVKGGLNVRGDGLSTLANYGFGSEMRFATFGFGASVQGRLTVKNDDYTDRPAYRTSHNNLVNAGSQIFNSVNPNSHDIELNFNYAFGRHALVKIYSGTQIMGSNSSSGIYAGVNVNWVFDFIPVSEPARHEEHRTEPLFKTKTDDGVNQEYFKPVTPVDNSYIQKIEESPDAAVTPHREGKVKVIVKPLPPGKDYKIKIKKLNKKSK